MIKEKEKAPQFKLFDAEGNPHSLSDFEGKPLVLYFYPRDDTPGCTKEACGFRDDYTLFRNKGIEIVGISPDTTQSHNKFKHKYELPFILLSDEKHKVAKQYGVWGKKKMYGREYDGIFRTTFIIDKNGVVTRVFKNVKPINHSQEVIDALESLKK